jgi:hypothetical protein
VRVVGSDVVAGRGDLIRGGRGRAGRGGSNVAPRWSPYPLLEAPAHPDFARAHPTLDHWLPVLVAAGAAGRDAATVLHRGFQHGLSTALVAFGPR